MSNFNFDDCEKNNKVIFDEYFTNELTKTYFHIEGKIMLLKFAKIIENIFELDCLSQNREADLDFVFEKIQKNCSEMKKILSELRTDLCVLDKNYLQAEYKINKQ